MSLLASEVLNSAKRRRQQELDERRMRFRRAIEQYAEDRQLSQQMAEHLDPSADYWTVGRAGHRQTASPGR